MIGYPYIKKWFFIFYTIVEHMNGLLNLLSKYLD